MPVYQALNRSELKHAAEFGPRYERDVIRVRSGLRAPDQNQNHTWKAAHSLDLPLDSDPAEGISGHGMCVTPLFAP